MHSTICRNLAVGALLVNWAAATPTPSFKQCKDYVLPVTVTSSNFKWALEELFTNFDATALTTDLGRWDENTTFQPIQAGPTSATATYQIAGTFCAPSNGGSGTVLLASHGFGFDRSYWNPGFEPENYSFVDYAIARGYSVFFYDRLGLGGSSIVSGYVAQVSIQEAILEQLVAAIRSGTFGAKPKSVVLLGHSFGSVISNALLHTNKTLVDAAVLTGIGYEQPLGPTSNVETFLSWQPKLARLQRPFEWKQLDGGYITWVDMFSNIATFFKQPYYDSAVVEAADARKQPFALMEVITLGPPATSFGTNFTGPVLVLTGEFDFIFCTGFCEGILAPGADATFPDSVGRKVIIHPNSGHAINLSLNATGAFGVITDFLATNGF